MLSVAAILVVANIAIFSVNTVILLRLRRALREVQSLGGKR